jgi:hypothetical protein
VGTIKWLLLQCIKLVIISVERKNQNKMMIIAPLLWIQLCTHVFAYVNTLRVYMCAFLPLNCYYHTKVAVSSHHSTWHKKTVSNFIIYSHTRDSDVHRKIKLQVTSKPKHNILTLYDRYMDITAKHPTSTSNKYNLITIYCIYICQPQRIQTRCH